MTHGSLFSGIGGFDLAAEWMGWRNLFHCEMNPFGQKVLNHYWPDAELFTDITKSNFTKYANRIDILTGGFPCQPYSHAGKRLGKEDDRHLWPEMLRAIREIQPSWVVGENVSGLISWNGGLVFHEVQTDLEAEGYEVFPVVLPAAGVGSCPHRRDRVWFIAYSKSNDNRKLKTDCNKWQCSKTELAKVWSESTRLNDSGNATNTNSSPTEHTISTGWDVLAGNDRIAPNPQNVGHEPFGATWAGRAGFENGNSGDATDTCNQGLQGGKVNGSITGIRPKRNKQLARCVPSTWENFPTQPPVCGRNDGISAGLVGITVSKHRNESIKAYGNAIVPQIAFQIFKAIRQLVLCNSNIER